MKRNALILCSVFGLFFTACPGETTDDPIENEDPVKQTDLVADQGGVAESPDGNFALALDAAEVVEDVTVKVTETPDPNESAASLSPAYVVDVDGDLAINFTADLTFALSAADAESIGVQNLRVAHGENLADGWDELLTGTYDSEAGLYRVTTYSFSFFMLVDQSKIEDACECDSDETCTADCGCDADCPANTSECSDSCMAQSGAGCCTGCGCDFEVQCTPECGSGFQWDCEIGCCYDYEAHVCEGES